MVEFLFIDMNQVSLPIDLNGAREGDERELLTGVRSYLSLESQRTSSDDRVGNVGLINLTFGR